MPYYRLPGGSIMELDPPRTVHARHVFEQRVERGEFVEVSAVKEVISRGGGVILVEDTDAVPAPAPAPAPADDAPPSTDKAELLAQLEALGASNLATLRRYSVERLTEELEKLTAPEE